jgi:hypothetical protein
VVGTGRQVVPAEVGAVPDGSFDHDVCVFFHSLDAGHQGLSIACVGSQVLHIQDQFTLLVGRDRSFEALKAMSGALSNDN